MNCESWTLMPFGGEITSFILSLYLWDFYVHNDFIHFVVILVLRREQECSCHGTLTDTRRFPPVFLSCFPVCGLPCSSGDACPPFGGEGQICYFVSSQNAKQKERCLEEGTQVELPARPASVRASREEGSGTNTSNLCSALDSCKKKKVEKPSAYCSRAYHLKIMLFSVAKVTVERALGQQGMIIIKVKSFSKEAYY